MLTDGKGKKWKFEDHRYCGPIVLGKNGDPLDVQPPENSPFWDAVQQEFSQRVENDMGQAMDDKEFLLALREYMEQVEVQIEGE